MKKILDLPRLIYFVIMAYILGAVIGMLSPTLYNNYLSLNFGAIFHGQIWRLLTWVLYPRDLVGTGIFFFLIENIFYYFCGIQCENEIGSRKFNTFYFIGFFSNIVGALIIYLIYGISYPIGIEYLNQSIFFLYAILFANNKVNLMFVLPIKVKWLGLIYAIIIGITAIQYFLLGAIGIPFGIAILITFVNVFWFLLTKNKRMKNSSKIIPITKFKKIDNENEDFNVQKCVICGSTKNIRYCSKCSTDLCYCDKHIKEHEHK